MDPAARFTDLVNRPASEAHLDLMAALIGASFDRDDVLATRDRSDERIVTESAEGEREPFEVVVGHRLVGEGEDVVLEPGRRDLVDDPGVELNGQIHTPDGCPARLPPRFNRDAHSFNVPVAGSQIPGRRRELSR